MNSKRSKTKDEKVLTAGILLVNFEITVLIIGITGGILYGIFG
jgi:hypothetical protein